MDPADRDRAIDRFVAGLPVDEDELALAVTARAVDAKIVVDALLRGLEHDSAVVRVRSAKRVAELVDLPQRLAARLQQLEATDADHRVREGAAKALRAHLPEEDVPVPVRGWKRHLAFPPFWLRPRVIRGLVMRGTTGPVILLAFVAQDRGEFPAVGGELIADDGELRLELRHLPELYIGCRLAVCVDAAGSDEGDEIGVAVDVVSEDGSVMITIDRGTCPVEELAQRLRTELELVVVE